MIRLNLILFLRNTIRNKTSFFINLAGLSTALASVLLIYLWVNDELNVDKFHLKDNQLYTVWCNRIRPDGAIQTQGASSNLAQGLKDEMPEVEFAVAVNYDMDSEGILTDGKNHITAKGLFADREYFHVFSYPLIFGDKTTVLANKSGIVITEGLAQKVFNTTENVIGKIVKWKHERFERDFEVSGVCMNPPANSTIQFDLIFSYEVLLELEPNSKKWSNSYANTYIILKKGTNIEHFNNKIKDFLKSRDERNKKKTLFLQQYSKNYLYNTFENGMQTGGRIFYVRLFSIIALFILIIACINFMNLSTAKASTRLKEVGIKKAIGVNRKYLVIQFMGETLFITILALFIAVALIENYLPRFNTIMGKQLSLDFNIKTIFAVFVIALFTGIISGSYPALSLSGFKPETILKGKFKSYIGEIWSRKGLVIFQFIISVSFIAVFIVINKQLKYIQTKDLGYSSDNIIFFQRKGNFRGSDGFVTALKNTPGVENSTSTNCNIQKIENAARMDSWEGKYQDENIVPIIKYPGFNFEFIETMGIKIKEGRSFSRDYQNEDSKVILNESAVKMMGFKEPIGKIINIDRQNKEVVGVVKNFHFESLYEEIEPLVIKFSLYEGFVYVKLKTGEEKAAIERIKKIYWKYHEFPLEFSFVNDAYQAKYESELKLAFLTRYASVITIIISSLGLFGLATFTAERRRKEIGIRKVMGANSFRIIYLISGDFTKLIFVSVLVALPLSYLITRQWLNGFSYRIGLGWWPFIIAGILALFIAWFTVVTQAIKAANINPVQCLKDE